ncbi:MAG: hypothetical protein JO019_04105 [Candidatus Kaiserbacteria bacterium]|nr:hypothetical protein [Candidatus Kaiserbacteria bacterium]
MNNFSSAIKFFLAAAIVIILGALLGWYTFIHRQIAATDAESNARGTTIPTFGGQTGSINANISGTADTGEAPPGKAAPRLWHVTKNPVAGDGFASATSTIYFAELSSGNVLIGDPSTSAVVRLSNTLMPKSYEARFAPDGSVILRSVGESGAVQTYAARLATSTESVDSTSTPMMLKGLYLPQDILEITTVPALKLLYLISDNVGGASLIQSDWSGATQKKLFSSPLLEWQLQVSPENTIVLTQKAADNLPGSAYALSGSTLRPLVENVPGLILRIGKGGAMLYSSSNGAPDLYAQASASAAPVHLPIRTSADKCVFAASGLTAYCAVPTANPGGYLSARFQGTVHTSDSWYRIDMSAGTAEKFFTPDPSIALDVENPQIDANGLYLAFQNGADRSLWMLRIMQ